MSMEQFPEVQVAGAVNTQPNRLGLRVAVLSLSALGLAGLAGVASSEGGAAQQEVAAGNNGGNGGYDEEHKIWICHGVNGEGENKNGWNLIEVDESAADGEGANDHTQHVRKDGEPDIIPAPGGENPYCPTDEEETTTTIDQPEGDVAVEVICDDGEALLVDVTPENLAYTVDFSSGFHYDAVGDGEFTAMEGWTYVVASDVETVSGTINDACGGEETTTTTTPEEETTTTTTPEEETTTTTTPEEETTTTTTPNTTPTTTPGATTTTTAPAPTTTTPGQTTTTVAQPPVTVKPPHTK